MTLDVDQLAPKLLENVLREPFWAGHEWRVS